MTAEETILDSLRGKLVVSCQALPGDPLRAPEHMAAMAASVARVPVAGIRAQGIEDLRLIAQHVALPLIGLWKVGRQGVYITPTAEHAAAVAESGADVVAIDATARPRPDGASFADSLARVHQLNKLVMADVSTFEEGVTAADQGVDIVSTTLSGYTDYSRQSSGPDLDLVERLAARLNVPVAAEGRVHTPQQAKAALDAGAWSVVVGSAITAPANIAHRFIAEMT